MNEIQRLKTLKVAIELVLAPERTLLEPLKDLNAKGVTIANAAVLRLYNDGLIQLFNNHFKILLRDCQLTQRQHNLGSEIVKCDYDDILDELVDKCQP